LAPLLSDAGLSLTLWKTRCCSTDFAYAPWIFQDGTVGVGVFRGGRKRGHCGKPCVLEVDVCGDLDQRERAQKNLASYVFMVPDQLRIGPFQPLDGMVRSPSAHSKALFRGETYSRCLSVSVQHHDAHAPFQLRCPYPAANASAPDRPLFFTAWPIRHRMRLLISKCQYTLAADSCRRPSDGEMSC